MQHYIVNVGDDQTRRLRRVADVHVIALRCQAYGMSNQKIAQLLDVPLSEIDELLEQAVQRYFKEIDR